MKIRKFATISLLVLSSFAADNVAPSKTELEGMYDKAFREFDANNYDQALKDLDAIDARQPDLAESQNLRGVIQMRQKDYANAEKALQKAQAADPKFWNARFNLAEIPFLQKNWAEARKRFEELLKGNASELQGEARQLIEYKILITFLMEGKSNMVESIVSKFEVAPETPAVHYANAAIALSKKDDKAAKEALTTAEKNFSPQLNKLFAESLYEVGWLDKPAGQTRAALELNSAAEKAAKTKAFAKQKYDEAEQALAQRDFTAARKLIDEADAADPNQAAIVNLRGEVMLEQKDFDGAENEFRKALKLDPKFRDGQYNLAQVPFKKKDYAKARERFESLFSTTSGADKDRAAQLIKYKVYLTYLLEGKDARAQKMMEQFQFTGDTPALYYAQAAWEFKHDNAPKANDWVTSARKIYPPALNGVFADAFFDLGWLQSAEAAASPAPAVAEATQPETAPTIEPTPISTIALAKNEPQKPAEALTLAQQPKSEVPGMEAMTSTTAQTPAASSALSATASPSVETPVASTASPAAAQPVVAKAPDADATDDAAKGRATAAASVAASPATLLAPAQVRDWSQPSLTEQLGEKLHDKNALLIGALLLAAILLITWAVIPELRRRFSRTASPSNLVPASGPSLDETEAAPAANEFVSPTCVAAGPPQVSLQLRASEPALRRATMPLGRNGRPFGNGNGNGNGHEAAVATPAPAPDSFAPPAETLVQPSPSFAAATLDFDEAVGEPQPLVSHSEAAVLEEAPAEVRQPEFAPVIAPPAPAFFEPTFVEPAFAPAPVSAQATEPVTAQVQEVIEAPIATPELSFASTPGPFMAEVAAPEVTAVAAQVEEPEPIGQGAPVPHLEPVAAEVVSIEEPLAPEPGPVTEQRAPIAAAGLAVAGIGALRHSPASSSFVPQTANEPIAQQLNQPTMATPTQPTPTPVIRTGPTSPMSPAAHGPGPGAQQQAAAPQTGGGGGGGMHTAVQLTFSTEIASLQLTPTFKMGSLQLKPTSRIVTMRLAPAQNPQPAMNLQVTFEVANVQLAGSAIGTVRLTPSQQQRPGVISSPSFNIAGLQLVQGSDAAPVQLTPSTQGQASVHMTGAYQITSVEFSPTFEIASIVLNSTSRAVQVQLPGSGPSAPDGGPTFEVTNVQLGGSGEIGIIQLNPAGGGGAQRQG
ncbi:MAG: tetratricopeptide repeat protein [Verrucomicrobiota bacterium]|nr:tetratricopeptide repeat protein [Verrucomicrobiota bacterium]